MLHDSDIVDILIVEDNPRDVELMLRALKKQNLANPICVVEDGAQALDFLFQRGDFSGCEYRKAPRVIFLDLKLPKVNGLEVLKTIKTDGKLKAIPVVVVSSSREDPDIEAAYALGANSYVVKPVDFDEFVKAMSRLGFYWLVVNQPHAE